MMTDSSTNSSIHRLLLIVIVVTIALQDTWNGVAAEEEDVFNQTSSPINEGSAVNPTEGFSASDDENSQTATEENAQTAEQDELEYEEEEQDDGQNLVEDAADSNFASDYEKTGVSGNEDENAYESTITATDNSINENNTNYENDNEDNNAEESNNSNDNNEQSTTRNKIKVEQNLTKNNKKESKNNTALNYATPYEEKEENDEDKMNYGGSQWPENSKKKNTEEHKPSADNQNNNDPTTETETYEVKYDDNDFHNEYVGGAPAVCDAESKLHKLGPPCFIHRVVDMFWKILDFIMPKGLFFWKSNMKTEEKKADENKKDEKKEDESNPKTRIEDNVEETTENVKTEQQESNAEKKKPETPKTIPMFDVNSTVAVTVLAEKTTTADARTKSEEENKKLEEKKPEEGEKLNEHKHLHHQHGSHISSNVGDRTATNSENVESTVVADVSANNINNESGSTDIKLTSGASTPLSASSMPSPYSAVPPQKMPMPYGIDMSMLYGLSPPASGVPPYTPHPQPHYSRYYHGKKANMNTDSSSSEDEDEGYFIGAQPTHADAVPSSLPHSRIELLKTVAMVTLSMAAVISIGFLLSRSRFFARKKNRLRNR